MMTTEPGWYPDPDDAHITRYWDGTSWVAQRAWDGTAWVQAEILPTTERVAPVAATDPRFAPTAGVASAVKGASTDRRKLMAIGGAIAGVLLLVVVGFLATSVFGGGGGSVSAFCNDRTGHELAASDVSGLSTNPDRWSSTQKASVNEIGDALRSAAGDAPAKIKPDVEKLVTVWTRLEHGDGVSLRDRKTFATSGDRVEAYSEEACSSNTNG